MIEVSFDEVYRKDIPVGFPTVASLLHTCRSIVPLFRPVHKDMARLADSDRSTGFALLVHAELRA